MTETGALQVKTAITGAIVLADGQVFTGRGHGKIGVATGELCFNTAMTGYQEILTDPSYAEQIVLFTFPHIGNVGVNEWDNENSTEAGRQAAIGAIIREPITAPSNWRAQKSFDQWLADAGLIAISGVDTRALTKYIRLNGMPKATLVHAPEGDFDVDALSQRARAWPGLENADLAQTVSQADPFTHKEPLLDTDMQPVGPAIAKHHIVVMDFGVKKNILRNLAEIGAEATIINGSAAFDEIMALKPDGIVLSNGPGDPAASFKRCGDTIKQLIAADIPILGICLGHQILALALGARTQKMSQGHHGANHPVKDFTTDKVEIVSMNHGFTVDRDSLPAGVEESHISLFDGSNCGLSVKDKPIISVQHHPEASPGPQDSFYLFQRFGDLIATYRASTKR